MMSRLDLHLSIRNNNGINPALLSMLPVETWIEKEIRERLSLQAYLLKITIWNPETKGKYKAHWDIRKKIYYALVWLVTESQDLKSLENHDKRGWHNYHLDHRLPIDHGYKNNILPSIIGNIDNLKFIPYKENLRKGISLLK